MQNTSVHPAPLTERLERLGLTDLLNGYIARERVGIRFLQLERFAHHNGYQFERENENIYGRLRLIPTPPSVHRPIIHLILSAKSVGLQYNPASPVCVLKKTPKRRWLARLEAVPFQLSGLRRQYQGNYRRLALMPGEEAADRKLCA